MCIDAKQNKVNISCIPTRKMQYKFQLLHETYWNWKFKILGVHQGLIFRIWEFDYQDDSFFSPTPSLFPLQQ